MSTLYRLVYASKNGLAGSEAEMIAEVERILAASRRNNARAGVTGALMFNGGAFAQVLEGPQQGVEETFERIQRDPRHGEVTVLECRPVAERGFTEWSMAFVGRSERGRALWNELAADSGFDLGRLGGDAVFAALHSLVLEDEGASADPAPAILARIAPRAGQSPQRGLDPAKVREEIVRQGLPGAPMVEAGAAEAAPAEPCAATALPVLRAALAEERARTTGLRGEVDELRVALAQSRAEHDALAAQRDLWMQRTRVLAAMLGEDPAEIRRVAAAANGPAPAGTVRAVA